MYYIETEQGFWLGDDGRPVERQTLEDAENFASLLVFGRLCRTAWPVKQEEAA